MTTRLLAMLTLCGVCLAVPGSAHGVRWGDGFSPEAIRTALPREGVAVLVATGTDSVEAREASRLLVEGLRGSLRARLVMDESVLGSCAGLSDTLIAQRAGALPIDLVAVVRVFPVEGQRLSAVITFADKAGNALPGFTVESRAPAMKALPTDTAAAEPDSRSAWGPAPTRRDTEDSEGLVGSPPRERLYLHHGSLHWEGSNRTIRGGDIYRALGDHGALRRYQLRMALKVSLVVVGVAGATTGLSLAGWAGINDDFDCTRWSNQYTCTRHSGARDRLITGSLVTLGVGAALIVSGAIISPHPMNSEELREAVFGFNLRVQSSAPDVRTPRRSMTLAPWLGPEVVGLALAGSL